MTVESRGLVVTSQHKGDSFTITTYIPPRRNGGPNCGAYGAAMVALAQINPDAFDPEPERIELAEGVTATVIPHDKAFAAMRDGAVPADDDEVVFPRACPTGGCGDE